MADHQKIISIISELRKSIRNLGLCLGLATLTIFFLAPRLLQFVQHHLDTKLYFFTVAGPFLAHVTLAFFAALYVLMPWFTFILWRALGKPFHVSRGLADCAGVGIGLLLAGPRDRLVPRTGKVNRNCPGGMSRAG